MRTIIAGSRGVTDYALVKKAVILSGFATEITEVVSGTAAGVDTLGERWAKEHDIPCKRMPANWSAHGRQAGFLRNREMAKYAGMEGALIAIWDGNSHGTHSMIVVAKSMGMRVHVLYV